MPTKIMMAVQQSTNVCVAYSRRGALNAALLFVCGCATTNSGSSGPLGAQISTRLPPSVPLETRLELTYSVTRDAYGSLYNVSTSGKVIALFENRALRAGAMEAFPGRAEPDIRLGAPIGRESFIFVSTLQPLFWIGPTDYIDRGPFPRLRFDRRGLLERLDAALAALPPGSQQMRSLDISVYA